MRRSAVAVVAAIAAAVALPAGAGAQSVSVSTPSSPTLRISTATAGQPPNAVTQSVGTYTFTTANQVRRLQARLNAAAPSGVTIEVSVDTHPSATNLGWVTLTTAYQDVVTSFPRNTSGTYQITYRVTASSAAGAIAAASSTITLRNQ